MADIFGYILSIVAIIISLLPYIKKRMWKWTYNRKILKLINKEDFRFLSFFLHGFSEQQYQYFKQKIGLNFKETSDGTGKFYFGIDKIYGVYLNPSAEVHYKLTAQNKHEGRISDLFEINREMKKLMENIHSLNI